MEWQLQFQDEFARRTSTHNGVDPSTWTYDIGNRDNSDPTRPGPEGWGNAEPQYYTSRPQNVRVVQFADATSALQITARSEPYKGYAYTSARLKTARHPVAGCIMPPRHADGTWVDGGGVRVEVRAKLPAGTPSGTWPAIWMLPTAPVYGEWPFSGEIDILEASRQQTEHVCGIHFGGPWTHRANLAARSECFPTPKPHLPQPPRVGVARATTSVARAAVGSMHGISAAQPIRATTAAVTSCHSASHAADHAAGGSADGSQTFVAEPCNASWHTWALEWSVGFDGPSGEPRMALEWSVDGRQSLRVRSDEWWTNLPGSCGEERVASTLAPFDQPFYVVVNPAVGGHSFAGCPPEGAYEQHLLLDYLRIYTRGTTK